MRFQLNIKKSYYGKFDRTINYLPVVVVGGFTPSDVVVVVAGGVVVVADGVVEL